MHIVSSRASASVLGKLRFRSAAAVYQWDGHGCPRGAGKPRGAALRHTAPCPCVCAEVAFGGLLGVHALVLGVDGIHQTAE